MPRSSSSKTKTTTTTKQNGSGNSGGGGGEIQISKSPAEFFAENQAIAGFDNMGKSLYTSIRELMENSLDACECIGVLPSISVSVEELTLQEFNKIRGISGTTKDVELFSSTSSSATGTGTTSKRKKNSKTNDTNNNNDTKSSSQQKGNNNRKKASQEAYFIVKVRDNGCGMKHESIPELLGRVLSGSKYGVRQTRGKFGLGAKMALIWSKKSTGIPIKITTSHRPKSTNIIPPPFMSTCILDIDITKNCPRIIQHKKKSNISEQWIGTELEILIAGNWTTYKARIVQYLQQLAIITPYAQLELTYINKSESQRNINIRYDRRSEQMPLPAKEVKHHPSSVNNLVIQQLLQKTKTTTITKFLTTELSCVSLNIAKRIVIECQFNQGYDDDDEIQMEPSELDDRDITKLVQTLRKVQMFKAPDGNCLSPLGEYNLNLGIRKVLEPDYVATARDKPSSYEGHPFVIEAAVSLGGSKKNLKEGLTIYRFANRIPLLFEAGADVSTRVALTKIKWSNYKIDYKRDKIGVFVSIVSTKIPYKGTGKEYIGDDITEISISVKRALQTCCQQLRTHLMKRNALRDQKERKSRLTKYIPDVTRSLYALLDGMRKRKRIQEEEDDDDEENEEEQQKSSTSLLLGSPLRRKRYKPDINSIQSFTKQIEDGKLTEDIIKQRLEDAVNVQNTIQENENDKKSKHKNGIPLYIIPLINFNKNNNDSNNNNNMDNIIEHPLFTFHPTTKIKQK